jgi:hypothetical protein
MGPEFYRAMRADNRTENAQIIAYKYSAEFNIARPSNTATGRFKLRIIAPLFYKANHGSIILCEPVEQPL